MFVANRTQLGTSPAKEILLDFVEAGIASAHPLRLLPRMVNYHDDTLSIGRQEYPLHGKRIFVIGGGKAAAAMAVALEQILPPERMTAGVVVANDARHTPTKIQVAIGDHPVPSERNVAGVQRMLDLKETYGIKSDDLIIAFLSGGGSSLLPYPVEGVTLDDKRKMVEVLIRSGATAHEVTVLKKKISRIKGGKLAHFFSPARIIAFVLSDVIGNDVDVIASGPFAEDTTTVDDAFGIIKRYGISYALPSSILKHLEVARGQDDDGEEQSDASRVEHILIGDHTMILDAIEEAARGLGISVTKQSHIEGEASALARTLCRDLRTQDMQRPALFLFGGESTVTLSKNHGAGGRNQEFIAACLLSLSEQPFAGSWAIASIATDGVDFIPTSMGGMIDDQSVARLKREGIDAASFLSRHDTHALLRKIEGNIEPSGPTGTNVCDVMMFLFL